MLGGLGRGLGGTLRLGDGGAYLPLPSTESGARLVGKVGWGSPIQLLFCPTLEQNTHVVFLVFPDCKFCMFHYTGSRCWCIIEVHPVVKVFHHASSRKSCDFSNLQKALLMVIKHRGGPGGWTRHERTHRLTWVTNPRSMIEVLWRESHSLL